MLRWQFRRAGREHVTGDALRGIVHARFALTREQRAAIRSDARVLVLHAGAGSGKTLTLARPFAPLSAYAEELAALEAAYAERKGDRLDYDDVPVALRDRLRRPAACREIAARLDHVLVDEFQDVNAAQADSIRLLAQAR